MVHIHRKWTGFWEGLLDLLYPPEEVCVCCLGKIHTGTESDYGRADNWQEQIQLCSRCYAELRLIDPPYCMLCGRHMERQGGEQLPLFSRCPECMRETSFLMARSYGKYEGVLRDLLHRFKFTREQELISVLGHCINEAWNRHFADRQIDWLVPVPVHPDRLRERGYNQAEMLALHLSSYSNIPVLSALQRTAHLKGQVTRDRQERLKALQSAYVCHSIHQSQVQEQRILLVDDIYTTGSTSEACARALRLAGATEVYVITVAR